ncbi:MAG: DsbA family protein [Rhodospirillaceae bacterium]
MHLTRRIALGLALCFATGAAMAAEPAAKPASQPVYREFVEGDPKAKVIVIEYASLTCPHCKDFHVQAYPQLKKNYIDTGKIRFVYRDFPLDGLAAGGALLARCAPGDRGKTMIDLMFKNQEEWALSKNPLEVLRGYAKLAGMSSADVDACLKNQAIMSKIREVQETASTVYKVDGTPRFFIGESMFDDQPTYEALSQAIDQALARAK